MKKTCQNTNQVWKWNRISRLTLIDKGAGTAKLTRAQIQKNQQQILLKALAKQVNNGKPPSENEEEEEKNNFDSDEDDDQYRYKLQENINHILRDQAAKEADEYAEVIDGITFLLYKDFNSKSAGYWRGFTTVGKWANW